jgi:RND family efflux transporter MFP subunit
MKPLLAVIGTIVALVTMAAVFGCHERQTGSVSEASSRKVIVTRPERGDMTRSLVLPGDLIGFTEAALHAKISGYVERITVDKGDRVKKGQVLAVLEVPELQQKLKRAQANLTVRRLTYERLHSVWKEDPRVVAREDVDVAQGEFRQAEAEVEEVVALVGYTNIVAPFDGVITARYVDPGALVPAAGQIGSIGSGGAATVKGPSPVVAIANIDILRVYVYVPEAETGRIKTGMSATLRLQAFPGREFAGTVARFAKALDLSTRTMLAEVDIENPNHELYPGMYAEVTLVLERHPQTLKLPATALGKSTNGSFVYIVQEDRVKKVDVKTGFTDGAVVEIATGLAGDEQVVLHLSADLIVGDLVQPVPADEGPGQVGK